MEEVRDCEACGGEGTFGPGANWLRPPGFAHSVRNEEGTSPDDQPERSYATRAKLTMPSPVDPTTGNRINERIRLHSDRQHLLVTNRGPREDGYDYCTICGLIEPSVIHNGRVWSSHQKPYPVRVNDEECPANRTANRLMLGTDFISDVLLISVNVDEPLTLKPGLFSTSVALRTVSEAISKAACNRLELEANELQAEFRPALNIAGRLGREAEIYLYDTLPGGAGFAHRVGELGLSVFEDALEILEECPDNCDRSCYRCLRSYKNKFEHDLLDRHLGASLLRYLIHGNYPDTYAKRLEASTNLLFEDLRRHDLEGLNIKRNHPLSIPGIGHVIAPIYVQSGNDSSVIISLHEPLMPDYPPDELIRDVKEYSPSVPLILHDEMAVRLNLPATTSEVIAQIGPTSEI